MDDFVAQLTRSTEELEQRWKDFETQRLQFVREQEAWREQVPRRDAPVSSTSVVTFRGVACRAGAGGVARAGGDRRGV
jgi:hypothetical protein